jgi:hypothetical protein
MINFPIPMQPERNPQLVRVAAGPREVELIQMHAIPLAVRRRTGATRCARNGTPRMYIADIVLLYFITGEPDAVHRLRPVPAADGLVSSLCLSVCGGHGI